MEQQNVYWLKSCITQNGGYKHSKQTNKNVETT